MKIAILGGTFDPIHNGHLHVARQVAETFQVDEFHFVPAFTPPHKSGGGVTSAFHRFAMVALAIAGLDGFRLSSIEVDFLEPRYTVDTLTLMHDRYPGSQFLFITGTDLYADIEEWKDYRRLFELTSLAVVHRPGFPMRSDLGPYDVVEREKPPVWVDAPRVYYMPGLDEEVSSSGIRDACRRGIIQKEWLPQSVGHYITLNRLYSP